MLIIDFETRSKCNLLTAGAYKYASDPSTEMICLGYKLHDQPAEVVTNWFDLPPSVTEYILKGDGLIAAWNAQFDRLIWECLCPGGWELPLDRWYCLAAQARVNALPGKLDECARAVTGKYMKDVRGPALIRQLSIPREDGTFNRDPSLIRDMCEYCKQDVEVSHQMFKATRRMSETEHRDWLNNEAINDDGVCVDTYLAELAIKYAETETAELADELAHLTDGEVTKHTQVQRIKKWVIPRLSTEAFKLTQVKKKKETKTSLDKNVRARLLAAADEHSIEMDPTTRNVLEILDEGNMSSVAKFRRMLERAEEDDRVRGAFLYGGASQTLRFASRGLQLHNFTRDCLEPDETEALIDDMENDKKIPGVMKTLSKALRPALVPEDGNVFVVGDWSAIEACALPWLSDDKRAEPRLKILADPDGDVYTMTQKQLKLADRQMGKVVELSMGYGGGPGAFAAMATMFGMAIPSEDVIRSTVVTPWREANAWANDFWNALEQAARMAYNNPGSRQRAGRVMYEFVPKLLDGTLVCGLPGGAMIQYPKMTHIVEETEWGTHFNLLSLKANWKPAAGETEWPKVLLWRGLLAENVTQAFCAAILRDALNRAINLGMPVVAHVHDEIVLEAPANEAEDYCEKLKTLMEDTPPWAKNLPLIAEPKIMKRYGK